MQHQALRMGLQTIEKQGISNPKQVSSLSTYSNCLFMTTAAPQPTAYAGSHRMINAYRMPSATPHFTT